MRYISQQFHGEWSFIGCGNAKFKLFQPRPAVRHFAESLGVVDTVQPVLDALADVDCNITSVVRCGTCVQTIVCAYMIITEHFRRSCDPAFTDLNQSSKERTSDGSQDRVDREGKRRKTVEDDHEHEDELGHEDENTREVAPVSSKTRTLLFYECVPCALVWKSEADRDAHLEAL